MKSLAASRLIRVSNLTKRIEGGRPVLGRGGRPSQPRILRELPEHLKKGERSDDESRDPQKGLTEIKLKSMYGSSSRFGKLLMRP